MGNTFDSSEDTPVHSELSAVRVSTSREIGYAPSKPTIPSALETQQSELENLFDEISRIEDRITPFLGHLEPIASDAKSPSSDSVSFNSPSLDIILMHNGKIARAVSMLRTLSSRVDS